MCRLPNSLEAQILQRQLAMKETNSHSFVIRVESVLQKYNLPSAFVLSVNPPDKLGWKKKTVKLALNDYWTAVLRKDASRKITLQFLGYGVCAVGKIHPVWDTARYSHIDI